MMGASRVIFVVVGAFLAMIGVLAAILTDRGIGPMMIFISTRTDQALFGAPPAEVLASNPALTTFRYVTIRALAGMLVAAGLLIAGLAWFGMSTQATWALAVLTVVGLVVIPFWWLALAPYREAGISVRLGDAPPFMWVPAIAMPVASLIGWLDHLRS